MVLIMVRCVPQLFLGKLDDVSAFFSIGKPDGGGGACHAIMDLGACISCRHGSLVIHKGNTKHNCELDLVWPLVIK